MTEVVDLGVIPKPLVQAIRSHSYSKGASDWSVTELIGPARISALKHRLAQSGIQLPEAEVKDRIHALIGTGVHALLEESARKAQAAGQEVLVERRYFIVREKNGEKYMVSGQIDYAELFSDGAVVTDYKTTSVWTAIYGPKPEHIAQLNLYALLLGENGWPVKEARLCLILRDWTRSKVGREREYPPEPVVTWGVPLWDPKEREAYLWDRLHQHHRARYNELPECTAEERWLRDAKIAVYKGANKRATKLFDPDDDVGLSEYLIEVEEKHPDWKLRIESRAGTNTRCEHYCEVSDHCSQYHALRAEAAETCKEERR